MSVEYKEISLGDVDFFSIFLGKRVLIKYLNTITNGTIPVYSANVFEPMGYDVKSNIVNFNTDSVIWAIDGYVAFNTIKKGNKFSTTDHCGTIKILNENILPEYLMIELERTKHDYEFDRGLRASIDNMKSVLIKIPTKNGKFFIKKQREIIHNNTTIYETKNQISNHKKKIENLNVSIPYKNVNYKSVPFENLFSYETGNSKLTKTYLEYHKGEYVAYSANTKENGIFGYIDNFDHECECLQITTNGVYAGHVFYRPKHKFSINADARLFIKKSNKLDYTYLLYEVRRVFIENNFGWRIKPTLYRTNELFFNIPIDDDGEFDLKTQKQIGAQNEKIYNMRNKVLKNLDKILDTNIIYD